MLVAINSMYDSEGNLVVTDRKQWPTFALPTYEELDAWVCHLRESPPQQLLNEELIEEEAIEDDDDDDDEGPPIVEGPPIGRGITGKSIETYLSGFATATKMAGHAFEYVSLFKTRIERYKTQDIERKRLRQAATYDPVADGMKIYDTVFNGNLGWTYCQRVNFWVRYLAHCNMIGRASDVSLFCPDFEDVEMPDVADWHSDGVPPYVSLVLRDWKWRTSKSRQTHYLEGLKFTVDRNLLDCRFDFCWWWVFLMVLRATMGYDEQGKVFDFATGSMDNSRSYANALKHVFVSTSKRYPEASYLAECTSHSVRRTMAQHARLSGLTFEEIMEIGRWQDMVTLRKYLDAAQKKEKELMDNAAALGKEYIPLFRKHWVFSTRVYVL